MSENIFEKGCLVQLSISAWRATKKISKDIVKEKFTEKEWVRASKYLIDPQSLKEVEATANLARNYLNQISLPFPIRGVLFVPKDIIGRVDKRLTELQTDFYEELEKFIEIYPKLRELAENYLDDLFNDTEYPSNVRDKFQFYWRFIIMETPDGKTGILDPELYEKEREKFINTMEEAKEMAVSALREEFAMMVDRISDRLTTDSNGKPKIFKGATITSFYEFFETFKERNIFKDEELSTLVEKAKDILKGVDPNEVRSDERLKNRIQERMRVVHKTMNEIITRPRRKITLD